MERIAGNFLINHNSVTIITFADALGLPLDCQCEPYPLCHYEPKLRAERGGSEAIRRSRCEPQPVGAWQSPGSRPIVGDKARLKSLSEAKIMTFA